MKSDQSVVARRTRKRKKSSKPKSKGYAVCLPEYEGDLSKQFDFSHPMTMDEVMKENEKRKTVKR